MDYLIKVNFIQVHFLLFQILQFSYLIYKTKIVIDFYSIIALIFNFIFNLDFNLITALLTKLSFLKQLICLILIQVYSELQVQQTIE